MNGKAASAVAIFLALVCQTQVKAEGWSDFTPGASPGYQMNFAAMIGTKAEAAIQAPHSVNNAPIGRQSFTLGFGGATPMGPPGAEGPGPSAPGGQATEQGGPGLPPPPGEGYQPCYQHGVFVGYYSPEEVALAQTDFPAALRSFVNSDRYVGGELGRLSILYEIGDIASPFPGGF